MNKAQFFFTPVSYQEKDRTKSKALLEKVDRYFFLGGKAAKVISAKNPKGMEKVALVDSRSSTLHKIFKVLSYFTIIAPLSLLVTKAILRGTHHYKVFNVQKHLEKGIDVSAATADKIQKLAPTILRRKDDEGIDWLSKGNNLVFRLKDEPKLVYKFATGNVIRDARTLSPEQQITERYQNMLKAQEICIAENLNLLTIPHAKQFEVIVDGKKQLFIAEESLDFPSDESAHEDLYAKHAASLKETTIQLASLVAKTGFNDVTWRNIPLINEAAGFQGQRRVALIDLEHMSSAANGFLGDGNGSRGLIRCVNADQIDLVIEAARKNGVKLDNERVKNAKARRLQELADDRALNAFYAQKGIQTGKELIDVDLSTLGLDLDATAEADIPYAEGNDVRWKPQTFTLREVAIEMIAAINKQIQKGSEDASVKGKRYIVVNLNNSSLRYCQFLGAPEGVGLLTKEHEEKMWMNQIIQALIKNGHLFKLEQQNGHGYFIQA